MDLDQALQQVVDERSFLAFVQALSADRRQATDWQNDSIEDFLDSAHAWAEASAMGASQGLADASPWKRFAVFLYCGKIYE
ncbi:DUF7660 family protein [Pseudomonas piscis]|uniref:DUF7660 family protein n=1 Tax=Pseudomonas piscis TaxID=2614538 RepID=UPI0021D58D95|nr:hypothetical protein [Pseudomonas piscis]